MAFSLLRYTVAAMQRHLEAGYKKEAGHKKLLLIPALFYAGNAFRTHIPLMAG